MKKLNRRKYCALTQMLCVICMSLLISNSLECLKSGVNDMIYLYNRTHIHINNNLQQAGLMNIHDIICDQPAKVIGELEFFGDDLLPQMIEENSTKAQKGDEKNDVPLTSVERIINKIVAGISYLLMAVVIFIKFFYKENEEEPPQPSS